MATYDAHRQCYYLTVAENGNGYTVTIPAWWSIAQVERYCGELRGMYGSA